MPIPLSHARVVATLACSLAILLLSSSAAALPDLCRLSRSPFIFEHSLPPELQCQFDQDGNGLDDQVEREIAACFVPTFKYDSEENAIAGSEPNVLFTAQRSGPWEVRLKLAALWLDDGGFNADDDEGCEDDHDGDSEGIGLTVAIARGAANWTARLTQVRDCSEEDGFVCEQGHPSSMVDPAGPYSIGFEGTHPILFPSAGKHHIYVFPARNKFDVSFAGHCWDPHRGDGRQITPGKTPGAELRQVPISNHESCYEFSDNFGNVDCRCLGAPDAPTYRNSCFWARGQQVPLDDSFQGNDLANLGYGTTIVSSEFLSDIATGVWTIIGNSFPSNVDLDADGRPDLYAPGRISGCEGRAGRPITAPTDRCPIDADESDGDGDGVYGGCDPDPYFRNQYVAGGSNAFPTFHEPEPNFSSLTPWQTTVGPRPRGGFWDSDRDGHVEGEDLCPTIGGGGALGDPASNWNSWGESLRFQSADGARDVGFFYRGNLCDPYPSTTTDWSNTGKTHQDHECKPFPRYETGGADAYDIRLSVFAGRSANDPNRTEPDDRTFSVQPFRCACPSGDIGDCMERDSSPCYSQLLSEADSTRLPGTSWRPVHHPSCELDADGYCLPEVLSNGVQKDVSWNWVDEYSAHPDHFPVGSIAATPATDPEPPFSPTGETEYQGGSYALWTATLEGESLIAAPGLAFATPSGARFPEPERTDFGVALADVSSPESRSLRSSFAPPVTLQSAYIRMLQPGNGCELPPIFDPCAVATCDWLQWWNWVVFPPDIERVGGGLIRDWAVSDAWFWQRRGDRLQDTYLGTLNESDLRLGLEEPDHWAADVPGTTTVLNAGNAVPAAMFVEHSTTAARWVLLEAVAQNLTQVDFAPAAEGELPSAISNQARLISDPRGRGVVLLDAELDTFLTFDFVQNRWLQQRTATEVAALTSSGVALSGSRLFVAPTTSSSGWIVDIYSGAVAPWPQSSVSRADPRLTPTMDGKGLLLSGGTDEAGPHDDVWLFPFGNGDAPSPTLVVSDSPAPDPKHSARALLGYSDGGPVLSVGSGDGGIGIHTTLSTGSRWEPAECLEPDLRRLAVFGGSQLWLGAGARVVAWDGATGAGAGSEGDSRIGIGALLGSLTTEGNVSIGFSAQLGGDVTASGSVVNHGTVSGQVRPNTSVELSGLGCFAVTFPTMVTNIQVAPHAVKALAPGAYSKVKLLPRATLRLRSGTYYVDRLEALPLSRIEFDAGTGPIRILIRDRLALLGDWASGPNDAERLLVGYLGTDASTWVRPFVGTLVAPNGAVTLANWEEGAFQGAFFAEQLNVLPGVEVHHVPFRGGISP